MTIKAIVIAGLEAIRIESGIRIPCQAAVFRSDYSPCTNRAVKVRGKWALCGPHGRLDEVEIVVDNDHDDVV